MGKTSRTITGTDSGMPSPARAPTMAAPNSTDEYKGGIKPQGTNATALTTPITTHGGNNEVVVKQMLCRSRPQENIKIGDVNFRPDEPQKPGKIEYAQTAEGAVRGLAAVPKGRMRVSERVVVAYKKIRYGSKKKNFKSLGWPSYGSAWEPGRRGHPPRDGPRRPRVTQMIAHL